MKPHPPAASPWRWPVLRLRWVLLALGFFLVNGLWKGVTVGLDLRASGFGTPLTRPLVWELSSSLVVAALLLLVQTVVLNAPWKRGSAVRFLLLHGVGATLFWGLHVAGLWTLRIGVYRLAGWGPYRYGETLPRVAMEGLKDVITFAGLALLFHVLEGRRVRQAQALAAARLEAELREARLQALSAQLDPHFLFNALNTLSGLMYEDLPRTDRLITALGQMLRDGLQAQGPTWALEKELDHLDHYLAFVEARFGDRFRVQVAVPPEWGRVPVPRFALQRLVENVLKHNADSAGRVLHVRIEGQVEGEVLCLAVQDDGVGFRPGDAWGLGLDNLRRTLELLHGRGSELLAEPAPGGGARVALRIPFGGLHG